jgi:proteasome lid subunit RPN8/RPN11
MSHPLLELPERLYGQLIHDLAASGQGVKESGAFLLGTNDGRIRKVSSYLMYETIAPVSSREHDYVALTAQEMAAAWDHCSRVGLEVVADVHTHPLGPAQSLSDRAHPMVSVAGHVALIVPQFAMRDPTPAELGVHVFHGDSRWTSMFGEQARAAVVITQ